jgi:hypothetical protein
MFCPQCGHQQVSDEIRFCSRCGLSLGPATDLLPSSGTQLQREKRELMGIGLMMATVIMLLNFLLVYGLVTLPHLANPAFLWIWLCFLLTAGGVGGFGLGYLIRGGYFKRLKQREEVVRLMKLEQERQVRAGETKVRSLASGTTPSLIAVPASVTETTTRELEPNHRARSDS